MARDRPTRGGAGGRALEGAAGAVALGVRELVAPVGRLQPRGDLRLEGVELAAKHEHLVVDPALVVADVLLELVVRDRRAAFAAGARRRLWERCEHRIVNGRRGGGVTGFPQVSGDSDNTVRVFSPCGGRTPVGAGPPPRRAETRR